MEQANGQRETDGDRQEALLRRQNVLGQFGEMALRVDDLDAVLHEACRLVGDALGTDFAKVMELKDDGRELLVRAGVGWHPGVVGHVTVKVDAASSEGLALETHEPVASQDIATEKRFEYAQFIKDHGVRSLVNVVILGADSQPPFGILEVDSRTPRAFDDADIAFLRGYANLLAATVERLHGLDRRHEIEAALRAEVDERRRLEEDLRRSNETLERRVEERTRALALAQQQHAETEERLRQGQKMEAIGQLTGGIAHDFNNLLTGITGSLDLIRRRLDSGRLEGLSRFMDAASTSAQRAAALTQRLLAFSRRQSLDARPVDVNALVADMEDLLRRTLGERIRLDTSLASDLSLGLCDHNQLENAILNLAINGRDAMPDGGQLSIATSDVHREQPEVVQGEEVAAGDYVVVCVSDNGVGMTPDVVSKAFDPFFTTKPIGQGTGLGLSMIYGFARQSGGYVRIDSEPGKGTEITLGVPRSDGALDRVGEAATGTPVGNGETVLVVEDDAAVRLLITEVLRELGYLFIEAQDAVVAEPLLRGDRRIDLLVSDVGLPGKTNGRELARLARELRPLLKILLVTGYAQSTEIRDRFVRDDIELLLKPFTLDALGTAIRDLMER